MAVCRHCHLEGMGRYCSNCGEIYEPKRITFHSIIHEAVHTFTHADKGILHTLKCLALHPGTMQKEYIEGERKIHQKPFALFFICATITAIALHFVNKSPADYIDLDLAKEHFYKNYYVIMQTVLLPAYALITWGVFYSKNFNYAEALVLMIYSLSFSLLIIIPINLLGYIFKGINDQLVEIIFLAVYMTITNVNFFKEKNHFMIVAKSVVVMLACYGLSYLAGRQVIQALV